MTFKGQVVCMFFPGGLLVVIGGALLDVLPGFGLGVAMIGFLLLIAWPIFSIIVHLRHEGKLKRAERLSEALGDEHGVDRAVGSTDRGRSRFESSVRDPLHTFLASVELLIFTFGLPVTLLGGLGVYCLVTAGDEPDKQGFKIFAGIGSLGLLGGYLFILIGGRSPLTLRIIGIAVAVFGLAGTFAVASVLGQAGVTSVGDGVMAVASVVMVAAGGWLAFTGRNSLKRVD